MSSARSRGVDGPNPVSFAEIAMWASLTGNIVRRDEVAILRKMDSAFIAALSVERAEASERAQSKTQPAYGAGKR